MCFISHLALKGDPLKLIFFGTPDFAVRHLQSLLNSKHEVLAVVTQPDKKSGRKGRITFCPVKQEAQKAGLGILQPHRAGAPDFVSELQSLAPSVIVVVAYGQILPLEIIDLPESGCINIHASLLPKYRGAAPINWAIVNGEKTTGITSMLMDEGMDTGPILLQQDIGINDDDTAGSLTERLSYAGSDILENTLKGLEDGGLKPRAQTGDVSYARALKKTDGLISWSKSAVELCNHIRGMNPWPGAYCFIDGERVKILKAVSHDEEGSPGTILKVTKDTLLVGTGMGVLSILEIQPAGKPVMAVEAFLQGRRISERMVIDAGTDG